MIQMEIIHYLILLRIVQPLFRISLKKIITAIIH